MKKKFVPRENRDLRKMLKPSVSKAKQIMDLTVDIVETIDLSNDDPEIEKIVIADKEQLADSWFKEDILASLRDVLIEWVDPSTNDGQSGIVSVQLATPSGLIELD